MTLFVGQRKLSPWVFVGLRPPEEQDVINSTIAVACEVWGVTPEELISNHRIENKKQARQFAQWFIARKTSLSLVSIGVLFHRHHSTVIHSKNAVVNALGGCDRVFKNRIEIALNGLGCLSE